MNGGGYEDFAAASSAGYAAAAAAASTDPALFHFSHPYSSSLAAGGMIKQHRTALHCREVSVSISCQDFPGNVMGVILHCGTYVDG